MTKSYLIDAVFALIIVISAVIGVKRGFLRSVSGIAGMVAGFFAAKALTPYASPFLERPMASWLSKLFLKSSVQSAFSKAASGAASGISSVKESLRAAGLSKPLSDAVAGTINGKSGGVEEFLLKYSDGEYLEKLGESAAKAIAPTIVFVALFIIARVLIVLLCRLFSGNIPVVRTSNRFLGLVLGIASGVLIVLLLCRGLCAFAPETGGLVSLEDLRETIIGGAIIRKMW